MSQKGVPIPGKSAATPMEEDNDDDLSVLLARSAPRIERHRTVVPIHKDDVEYSDFDRAIAIAVDESSNSKVVVEWAAERLLRRRKDLVVLVNVQPESKVWRAAQAGDAQNYEGSLEGSSSRPGPGAAAAALSSRVDEDAKERCRRLLSPYAEQLQRDGFVVKGVCLIGNPKEVLVANTTSKKPTMLVMGSHGRGSLKRYLMGSVAEYVLHHSTIPVVVVPNGVARPADPERAD
ncbi:hypothetical protein H4R19_002919 [Coemansia spiralis]|nr:hypothetical protein H4R19_002919 [Coemansia spiralis]